MIAKVSNPTKVKTIAKIAYSVSIVFYMSFLFPTQLRNILDYHKINKEFTLLSKEVYAASDTLLSALDVHTIVANSGTDIQLSSIQDVVTGELKRYAGEEIPQGSYILEYIIPSESSTYLFSYLSTYTMSFESINIEDSGEIILRIFSK